MATTTRRVNESELGKIKELQALLELKGIKLSQANLSEMITNFAIDNMNDFIEEVSRISSPKFSEDQKFLDFINKTYTGDVETDSVEEHDVVF